MTRVRRSRMAAEMAAWTIPSNLHFPPRSSATRSAGPGERTPLRHFAWLAGGTVVAFVVPYLLGDRICLQRDNYYGVRARVDYKPVWHPAVVRLLMVIAFGLGDLIQPGAMLGGIKRRTERCPPGGAEPPARPGGAAVDLYWIPLGAGGHCVRFNGKVFEALEAARQHRARHDLYHAALIVQVDGTRYTIELAPSLNADEASRGVVATGIVGSRLIGWLRLFRYEVRCWAGGSIPDLDFAVGIPDRLTTDRQTARRLLATLPNAPTPVWGRDELGTGEMWNSNSLISWSLATTGFATDQLQPPAHGRAPGWESGLTVARRNIALCAHDPQTRQPAGAVTSSRCGRRPRRRGLKVRA